MSVKFDPAKDIPDLSEKVCLVTGGNSGLGEATITAIAQHNPKKIYLAARNRTKAEDALKRIKASSEKAATVNIEVLDLDLSSLESVKAAASKVNNDTDRLDILQLNGGVASLPHAVSKDGYEIEFATNYLGHALLTQLLMPKLLSTSKLPGADVRIMAISSVAHRRFAPESGIMFDNLKTDMSDTAEGKKPMIAYGQSNVARTLFAFQLAKQYPSINSTSIHPGTVITAIWDGEKRIPGFLRTWLIGPFVRLTGVTSTEGAKNQLWSAFGSKVESGAYYEPVGKRADGKFTRDANLAQQLWDWTDAELKEHGAPGWTQP